jgi:predicted RNase H-like nuclease (RuvC/YqgF family)
MDYFSETRVKELEQQNEVLRYRVNALQSEIETLRNSLARQFKAGEFKRWDELYVHLRKEWKKATDNNERSKAYHIHAITQIMREIDNSK